LVLLKIFKFMDYSCSSCDFLVSDNFCSFVIF